MWVSRYQLLYKKLPADERMFPQPIPPAKQSVTLSIWNNEECAAFADKVYEMFPNAGLNAMHLSSYLGVYMVSDAITQAGTNNARDGLAKTYGAMDYQTINGRYVFKEDHTAIASPEHLVISAAQVQNGEYKVVWPANFAYAEPVAQK